MLSVEQLIQNLMNTTQPSVVRCSAIVNLVSQGSSQGIEALIEVLADSDSMVRREAAMALQQMDATRATQPLLEALQVESNDLTLWALLEAIGELATPDMLPMLESLRTTGSMLTRIEAKKSMARIEGRYANGGTSLSPEASESVLHAEQIDPNEPSPTADFIDSQTTPEEDIVESESNVSPHNMAGSQATPSDDLFIEAVEDTETVESGEKQPTEFEKIFISRSVDSDEITDISDYTASTDERVDVPKETESADDVTDTPEKSAENTQSKTPTDTLTTDTESTQREKEDQEIDDLAESIARSSRLAGSSVNLPVLAPNASTVPYDPKGTALEPAQTSFFLTLIHPGRYLSKQWVQRTRVYLILWAVLVIVIIGFTQYQKHTKMELSPLSRFGLSMSELPELVKRSLAEGDFYIQEGYYRKAINSYELSRGLGALPVSFYRKLGFAYFKEGQHALSVEAYELFLETRAHENPDVFAAEASLVGVYPLTSVEVGITRDYETYNILGTAYMKLGRVLDAKRTYEKAIQLVPKYGEAYNNLARLYADNYPNPIWMKDWRVGRLEAWTVEAPLQSSDLPLLQTSLPSLRLAEALAYTAVTLNPDVAAYHDTLGWVLSKRGQVNKGMKTLERAINLQSDAVEPHYHLAQVALKANERQKAIEAIRNVFKLNPAFVSLNTTEQR
ncbi:MAG: tetratricopeptide repeat protein [Candidatus Poribacteria bacterium]|nr:tetratricopeptide repeat protein [Candidatus Poribacteria bacterium]